MSIKIQDIEFGFRKKVPIILQTEAAECGLACLAMILNYHGNKIDLSAFRRKFSISISGVTLKNLVEVSNKMNLTTRALRLDMEDLPKLVLPCVLHWGLNHFVVLVKVGAKTITINDPARGQRKLTYDEVSKEFTGVALEATPNESFVPKDERSNLRLRDLFRQVANLRSALVYLFLFSLGLEVIAIIMPMISQVIIDEVIVTYDNDLLVTVAFGIALLLLTQMTISTFRSWFVMLFSTKVGLKWRTSLFDHLSRLPLDYFAKRHVGDVISRFGSLDTIQKTVTTDMVQSVMDGIMAIGMAIMIFLYGGWLGAIACIAVALDVVVRFMAYRPYRSVSEEAIVYDAKVQTHFIETVRSMASVKLLGLRESRMGQWTNLTVDSINARLKLQRYDLFFGRVNDFIFGADRLFMMVLGARSVMHGHMSVGMLVAFLSYKDQFASRVGSLIGAAFKLRMLNIQSDRLSDIVMEKPEVSADDSLERPQLAYDGKRDHVLTARGVSLRYGDQDPWILRDLSMTIGPRKRVAIIGPSGCGKTTFLKVLMGLIPPTEGVVSLDDFDVRALGLERYRDVISGVLQDDGLFSGTIADNITGFGAIDPVWMEQCAAMASILDDINKMPMRFETLVGDMGSTLSGGQKQRVILARALYRRPKILFLDEATSHLDELTEKRVAEALRGMDMAQVIVAHRPATIAHADVVYYLDRDGLRLLKSDDGDVSANPGQPGAPGPVSPAPAPGPGPVAPSQASFAMPQPEAQAPAPAAFPPPLPKKVFSSAASQPAAPASAPSAGGVFPPPLPRRAVAPSQPEAAPEGGAEAAQPQENPQPESAPRPWPFPPSPPASGGIFQPSPVVAVSQLESPPLFTPEPGVRPSLFAVEPPGGVSLSKLFPLEVARR